MNAAKKVVLVSRSGYDARNDALLLALIDRKIHLFCAVGEQCEVWEEVMDALCVGPAGEGDWFVTTTSHPGEAVSEVVAFAEKWHLDEPSHVETIEV